MIHLSYLFWEGQMLFKKINKMGKKKKKPSNVNQVKEYIEQEHWNERENIIRKLL